MHSETSEQIATQLLQQYNALLVPKPIVASELGIEECTLNAYMGKGIGIFPYVKIGKEKGSKVLFNIHDLAYFLATDTSGNLTRELREKYIYDFLFTKYSRRVIGKKEFASFLDVSTNTIGEYMKNNIIPFTKHGKSKNARVTFSIMDIAKNLSNVIETM